MEEIHTNQVVEVLPYQYEPEPNTNVSSGEDSDSESQSSSDEDMKVFEAENAWRLESLDWCKCGNCKLNNKAMESFCCQEKALEYDDYDSLLSQAEEAGYHCVTCLPDFAENMLSQGVLKIDVCRYLEENWPVSDEDIERTHKLYRLVAYQRCSRWIFRILGKNRRRPFPSCIYAKIRDRFASPDGLYTHFKYAKKDKGTEIFNKLQCYCNWVYFVCYFLWFFINYIHNTPY